MKERPILFSTEMVRAILDGRKTQTRRVVKPQPCIAGDGCWFPDCGHPRKLHYATEKHLRSGLVDDFEKYQIGDRLWVRETHCAFEEGHVHYRADYADGSEGEKEHGVVWTPSIHMPRWASRILLEVTDVRVERAQEISAEDILAEGVRVPRTDDGKVLLRITGKYPPCDYMGDETLGPKGQWPDEIRDKPDFLRAHFASLWDSINAKRGYGWDKNPWVWAITFKVVKLQKGRAK